MNYFRLTKFCDESNSPVNVFFRTIYINIGNYYKLVSLFQLYYYAFLFKLFACTGVYAKIITMWLFRNKFKKRFELAHFNSSCAINKILIRNSIKYKFKELKRNPVPKSHMNHKGKFFEKNMRNIIFAGSSMIM